LKLADWCALRLELNRELGIVTKCGCDFDPFPGSGMLTRPLIERVFAFERALFGRADETGLERLLENARERGQMPSKPFVGWR